MLSILSSGGSACITSTAFDAILCNLRFAVANIAWVFMTRSMASSGLEQDVRPSST